MKITSRYSDQSDVVINPDSVPTEFRHLIPLAKEWSIGDDLELDAYINACSKEKKQELVAAFQPFFEGLWNWHLSCEKMCPQPDELILFDMAAHAAATAQAML